MVSAVFRAVRRIFHLRFKKCGKRIPFCLFCAYKYVSAVVIRTNGVILNGKLTGSKFSKSTRLCSVVVNKKTVRTEQIKS